MQSKTLTVQRSAAQSSGLVEQKMELGEGTSSSCGGGVLV